MEVRFHPARENFDARRSSRLWTKVGGEDRLVIEMKSDAARKSIDKMVCSLCYGLAVIILEPSTDLRTIQ